MTEATITETIGVGNTTGLKQDGVETRPVEMKLDLRREYVAGTSYAYGVQYLRTLPFYIDDITRDFGDDLYERMLLDSQVSSDVETIVSGVLAQGVQFLPARKKGEDGDKRAVELSDFCNRVIENMEEDLYPALRDMLGGIATGNRFAEKVYEPETRGKLAGKLVLKHLKVKPRRSFAYVMDPFMNTLGAMALVPGQPNVFQIQGFFEAGNLPKNFILRDKFCLFTHRRKDEEPRGQSILRAAYTAWLFKTEILPQWLQFGTLFAGPSVWGTIGEGSVPTVDPVTGEKVNPLQSLLDAMLAWKNHSAMALPFGHEIHVEHPQGTGAPFMMMMDWCDQQISKAITLQTLATMEGEHQARAASGNHQDILNLVIGSTKKTAESMLRRDIARQLIRQNYPEADWELQPRVSLSGTDSVDLAAILDALAKAGYEIDPSQYLDLDQMLDLPIRAPDSVQAAIDRKNAPTVAVDPNAPKPDVGETDKTDTDPAKEKV